MRKIGRFWREGHSTQLEDPPIARLLFSSPTLAWLWLPLRVWLGWTWWQSGWGKFQNPNWMETGSALQGFWSRAVVVDPKPVTSFDWYRDFLELMLAAGAHTWFAKLIVFGELVIGLA